MKNKRGQIEGSSQWWTWLLFILILTALGVLGYFLLGRGRGGFPIGGSSIPIPPPFPA